MNSHPVRIQIRINFRFYLICKYPVFVSIYFQPFTIHVIVCVTKYFNLDVRVPSFPEIDSPSPINSSGKRDLREVKSMKNSPLYRDSINVLLRHPFIVIPRVMVHVLCLRVLIFLETRKSCLYEDS